MLTVILRINYLLDKVLLFKSAPVFIRVVWITGSAPSTGPTIPIRYFEPVEGINVTMLLNRAAQVLDDPFSSSSSRSESTPLYGRLSEAASSTGSLTRNVHRPEISGDEDSSHLNGSYSSIRKPDQKRSTGFQQLHPREAPVTPVPRRRRELAAVQD
jgi:hypothetical protein